MKAGREPAVIVRARASEDVAYRNAVRLEQLRERLDPSHRFLSFLIGDGCADV
jgi:hypothetical protein